VLRIITDKKEKEDLPKKTEEKWMILRAILPQKWIVTIGMFFSDNDDEN
jgi:hypothetical protein